LAAEMSITRSTEEEQMPGLDHHLALRNRSRPLHPALLRPAQHTTSGGQPFWKWQLNVGAIRLPECFCSRQNWRSTPQIVNQLLLNHRLSRQRPRVRVPSLPPNTTSRSPTIHERAQRDSALSGFVEQHVPVENNPVQNHNLNFARIRDVHCWVGCKN